LTGDNPEYSILVLSASYGGLPKVSKEQIMLTKLLEIPLIIFITKIDIARGDDLSNTLHELMMLLKSPDFNRVPVVIQNSDDLRASMDAIMKRYTIINEAQSCHYS
jgi:GTPase